MNPREFTEAVLAGQAQDVDWKARALDAEGRLADFFSGQVAYEAYMPLTYISPRFGSQSRPEWAALTEDKRSQWVRVAKAVLAMVGR